MQNVTDVLFKEGLGMKKAAKKAGKRLIQFTAAMAVMLCLVFLDRNTIISNAADIKLKDNAKVRSEASTSSNVVGNASSGTTLSLKGETTGSDGYVWYQVSVGGATGYIRSDLAEKVSGDMTQAEVERENSYTETSATVSETSVSSAKIAVDSANIRKGPSSTDAPVMSVKSGTEVSVSGEAIGSDGKTWYQVSVNGKTGFVRSDLVKESEPQEQDAEEDPAEMTEEPDSDPDADIDMEEEAEESGRMEISNVISSRILPKDTDLEDLTIDESLLEEWESGNYYVLYTKDSDGDDGWYLYSLEKNQFEKIDSLQGGSKKKENSSSGDLLGSFLSGSNKIILLAVAAVFLVLIIVCIVLAFKLHEYRVYYEDDEEDEDDAEEDSDDDNSDEDDPEEEDPDDDEEDSEEDEEEELRPARKPRWRPKNFLSRRDEDEEDEDEEEDEDDDEEIEDAEDDGEAYLEDDDFEFEFLNMDDDKF